MALNAGIGDGGGAAVVVWVGRAQGSPQGRSHFVMNGLQMVGRVWMVLFIIQAIGLLRSVVWWWYLLRKVLRQGVVLYTFTLFSYEYI